VVLRSIEGEAVSLRLQNSVSVKFRCIFLNNCEHIYEMFRACIVQFPYVLLCSGFLVKEGKAELCLCQVLSVMILCLAGKMHPHFMKLTS
jgi:hypothetical protein